VCEALKLKERLASLSFLPSIPPVHSLILISSPSISPSRTRRVREAGSGEKKISFPQLATIYPTPSAQHNSKKRKDSPIGM